MEEKERYKPKRWLGPQEKTETDEQSQTNKVINMQDNMTSEERAIYSRVAAESDEWKTITEGDIEDFSLAEDPFKLPLPAQKLRDQEEFAFRWITRTQSRVDEMKNKRPPFAWWPVNSMQPVAGLFDKFIDPIHGGIGKEDQILVFKPWWMFQKELDYERMLADGNSADITSKNKAKTPAGDLEYRAGKRSGYDSHALREEVKGSDIQFDGETEVDLAAGIYTPQVSESDLAVNE